MFERLSQIESKYDELTQALASPEIISDSAKYQKTAKAHSELAAIVEKYREFKDLRRGLADTRELLAAESDPEMKGRALRAIFPRCFLREYWLAASSSWCRC